MSWTPVTPAAVIAKAREYLGTPYHPGARVKGAGVDCIGLVVCVFGDLGVAVDDWSGATEGDQIGLLTDRLDDYCDPLTSLDDVRPGDILLFRYRSMNHHTALCTESGLMIHAYDSPSCNRVVEQSIDDSWERRFLRGYRYKGMQ